MTTSDTIKSYFAGYAAAVAQSRALISVEDGLKPSLRMALYANYTDKYINPNKTAKFLKLIGSASRFCWHGDAATYGMLCAIHFMTFREATVHSWIQILMVLLDM